MKKTMITGLVLLVLLAFAGCAALAEGDKTVSSTASISFVQGELEFVDVEISGMRNMNIDFGSNDLPLGEVNYTALTGTHTLRVSDPRDPAGKWQVSATLGRFESTQSGSDGYFEGAINLKDPDQRITNNGSATITVPNSITLVSGEDATLIMKAEPESEYERGWFDVTWLGGKITLSIDETNALLINDYAEYSANITWTLVSAP